ncbi:MAG: OmpH family outer membrane protein [Rhodospirillaceae bacterium]|nr:OmpH family outer membrane protein [Rhodospirillaceae bacterium]
MKSLSHLFSIALIAVWAALSFPHSSMAQETTASKDAGQAKVFIKVGIIDIVGVRTNSSAIKDIHKQITKFRDNIQATIQKEEKDLRKANDELARQRTILSPEAFNAERVKFEKKLSALQKRVQDSKQSLGRVQAEATAKVDKAILGAIQKIIEEDGYTLILKKSSTIANAQILDLTADILKRLDKNLPAVKVSNPSK